MKIFLIFISIILSILGCQEGNNTNSIETKNSDLEIRLSWKNIKSKFPNSDIIDFDFSYNGQPLNNIKNLPKLDSLTFNELVKQVKTYEDWSDYLEIYYFSKNTLKKNEFGIFLTIREFDGTSYSFDAIQINEKGKIIKFRNIANSWVAAECLGYTRTKINYKDNTMLSQTLQKCYDEESVNNERIDSIIILTSILDLNFKEIKSDTIK